MDKAVYPGRACPFSFGRMSRTFGGRVIASLLAVWFGLIAAEPAALHACQVHEAAHHAASHSMHAAHHPERGHAHVCTCLGACCAGTVSALRTGATAIIVAHVIATAVSLPPTAPAQRRPAPAHARPPSVGPPVRPA